MNKNTKKTILETIEYLLELRYDLILGDLGNDNMSPEKKAEFVKQNLMETRADGTVRFAERFINQKNIKKIEALDKQLIKLNHLLPYFDRNTEILTIEQQMQKIQAKKNITVKEFTEIYNVSASSQRDYRYRSNDPLPYHQKVAGGKIVYVVEEVEKWFENQHR